MLTPYWRSGDAVVMRDIWNGKISNARPVTVVRDSADLIALWTAPGTRWKVATKPDGRTARIPLDTHWDYRERVWTGGGVLHLMMPGAAHATWALWSEGNTRLIEWYVNLQEPVRRTRIGFDYTDHLLDLVISADFQKWHWKDQGELREACARGLLPLSKTQAIQEEGERVLASVMAGRPPFSTTWSDWSPDPTWPVPELPANWDEATDSV